VLYLFDCLLLLLSGGGGGGMELGGFKLTEHMNIDQTNTREKGKKMKDACLFLRFIFVHLPTNTGEMMKNYIRLLTEFKL